MSSAFERAITLPISYHAEQGSGRVVRIMLAGTDQLFALWLSFLREHLTAIVEIVLLIPAAISIDVRLAALLAALAVLYFLANTVIIKRTHGGRESVGRNTSRCFRPSGRRHRQCDRRAKLYAVSCRNERSARADGRPSAGAIPRADVVGDADRAYADRRNHYDGGRLCNRSRPGPAREVTVGQIVAFVGFSNLLISKLDMLSGFVGRIFLQVPTLYELLRSSRHKRQHNREARAVPLEHVEGRVQFDDVTYRFPYTQQGVFNLSFEAPPGETIALVGPTGSGKTTTLALLQRLRDPQEGKILIDGTDIRDVTLTSLRQSIAVVFQDAGLFNRSIAENIRIGRPRPRKKRLDGSKLREAHDFILSKAGGYQFVIGERGSALSGGERQRIAIARAILKNAPILILDEATSALDNETEAKIKLALEAVRRGRTTFLIAHRLSTVANANQIIVLDHGRIVEAGTFHRLAEAGRLFERLVKAGSFEEDYTQEPSARAAE